MANVGKDFENQIRESIIKLNNVYYLRMPDPPQSFKQDKNNGLRFSNNNPFDFLMYTYPYLFAIENKSSDKNLLSWTLNKDEKSKNIKKHQIEGLFDAYKKGAIAGFLFNFRTEKETYFMHIMDFMTFIANSTKKSINIKDIQKHGGILIPQRLKVVKFDYDMEFLINECADRYEIYKAKVPKT